MFMVRLGAIAISDLSLQGTAFYRDHAMEGGPLSPPQRHVMSSNDVHACAVGVDVVVMAFPCRLKNRGAPPPLFDVTSSSRVP